MNWRVAFSIARKDIVDAVRNMYILFSLIMPVAMSLLLQFAFGNFGEENRTLSIVIYDPDGSRLAAGLAEEPGVAVTLVNSEAELMEQVQEATGGLLIPPGFDAAVEAGSQPELVVYSNDRRGGGELAAFRGLIEQSVWQLEDISIPAKISWETTGRPRLLESVGSEGGLGNVISKYFLIMLLMLGMAMAGVFVVPYLLIEEKEKHTLDALLVTPAGPAEVTAGKAMVGLFYCTLISGLLILLNKGWTGNWPITLAAVFLGAVMLVGVGLLLGGMLNSMSQVNTWSSVIMMILILPSWFVGIIEVPSMQAISKLIPTYYLADTLTLSLPGSATLATVWGNLAIILACVVVLYAAVMWSLRKDRVA